MAVGLRGICGCRIVGSQKVQAIVEHAAPEGLRKLVRVDRQSGEIVIEGQL
jgi:hypothetical protein